MSRLEARPTPSRAMMLASPLIAALAMLATGSLLFLFLGLAFTGLSLLAWRSIFRALGVAAGDLPWLLAAIAFASPLFQVTLRADAVWQFAQALGFLMTTLSLWAVICRRSLALAIAFADPRTDVASGRFAFAACSAS